MSQALEGVGLRIEKYDMPKTPVEMLNNQRISVGFCSKMTTVIVSVRTHTRQFLDTGSNMQNPYYRDPEKGTPQSHTCARKGNLWRFKNMHAAP